MRSRIALWISLALNVALAAAFGYFFVRREPPRTPPVSQVLPSPRTSPIIERTSWSAAELQLAGD